MSTIRPAYPTDADAIQYLYRQLVNDENISVDAARIQAVAEDPRTHLLVCESNGAVCGTLLVCVCNDVMYQAQPFAVLENLVVDDRHRGQGTGKALLHEAERICRECDCSKIMVLSSVRHVDAHRFFEREGFRADMKVGFVKYRRQFSSGG